MFERAIVARLRSRLHEPRHTMQVIQGPRQVGKTTAVRQVLQSLDLPSIYESADSPFSADWEWLREVWSRARALSEQQDQPVILALDEIQKLPRWTGLVKQLWDEDTWQGRDVRVVLLGSSPIQLGRALTESMAGRYEIIRATHWTWGECREAFGWDLDDYVYYGGYPGVARFKGDESRWREYVTEVALESTISRDVLHMSRVDKPALLRRVAYLAAEYSGRELSYRKMLGQLDDAGNATTIAHYLDLLEASGIASGLQKWAGEPFRKRASTPKLLVHNTGLMSALSTRTLEQARADGVWWGRLVETCVGAHLMTYVSSKMLTGLYYWRHRGDEVDYVLRLGDRLIGVEVKSGAAPGGSRGFEAMSREFRVRIPGLVVGTGGIDLAEFLEMDLVTMR